MPNKGHVFVGALALAAIALSPVLFWVSTAPLKTRLPCQDPPPNGDCSGVWDFDLEQFRCNGGCVSSSKCKEDVQILFGETSHRCTCDGVQPLCSLKVIEVNGEVIDAYCLNYELCFNPLECHVHYSPIGINDMYCLCHD